MNSNPRCFNSLPARSDAQMAQPAQAWLPVKWGVSTSCLQQVLAFILLIVASCLSSLVDVSEFFKFFFPLTMYIDKSNLRKRFYLGLKLKDRVPRGREVMAAGL